VYQGRDCSNKKATEQFYNYRKEKEHQSLEDASSMIDV
jgi:hypothetical protein